jgi:hypothetical protein
VKIEVNSRSQLQENFRTSGTQMVLKVILMLNMANGWISQLVQVTDMIAETVVARG